MTERDGLTAEQEAERRWPVVTYDLPPYADMFSTMARRHFIEGAEWATEREKARAEAAEARVAELEVALKKWVDWYDGVQYADRDVPDIARESRLLIVAAPTTKAVTEVEGS